MVISSTVALVVPSHKQDRRMKSKKKKGEEYQKKIFSHFSWGNTKPAEDAAMNNLTMLGYFGTVNMGSTHLRVFVKVHHTSDDTDIGIDVYKVYSGCLHAPVLHPLQHLDEDVEVIICNKRWLGKDSVY